MTFFGLNLFGMSGEEIYHNFHGGTGDDAKSLYNASWKVMLLTKKYDDRAQSITALTTQMEGAWQGDAAGAAQRGAGPLAVEHGLAQQGMTTAHDTLANQVSAFQSAKDTVTKVPAAPEEPGVWDNLTTLGGAGRDYETQMNEVSTANDHNVTVMEGYETTTSSNVSAMPTSYGRITDDYSQVGVEKPAPPPQTPMPNQPPPNTTGNFPGSNGTGTTPGSTLPGGSTNPGNTRNPPAGGTTLPAGGGTTNPSNNRPPVMLPPGGRLPGGQNPGGQTGGNNPALTGMMPPAFGPNGGGSGGGFGPRGSGGGFGPGGSGGAGGSGSGSGSGARPGSGFGPGGAAAAGEGAAGRGGVGAGRGMGGMGGGGMGGHGGGGRRGQGEDDGEHERPSFLVEPDPHETFGTDEVTAPPVIGE